MLSRHCQARESRAWPDGASLHVVLPSQAGWVYLGQRGDPEPRLVFQPVPEPKVGKVRIHLDVTVGDVNEAIGLVTALGGRSTGERHDYEEGVVVVMADPEGHEFCLVQYY